MMGGGNGDHAQYGHLYKHREELAKEAVIDGIAILWGEDTYCPKDNDRPSLPSFFPTHTHSLTHTLPS